MQSVNIHMAKTHLSMLLVDVEKGQTFVIARAGKPIARVIPYKSQVSDQKRIGFLKGACQVPPDFDEMEPEMISTLFEGRP